MIGGFQPVAFQVNFQQGGSVSTTGLVWVERPQFRVQQRFSLPPQIRPSFTSIDRATFAANARILFKSKRVGESVFLKPSFDFISALAPTETILTAVVTAAVYTGVDPNPSAIISGGAVISGTQVTQLVVGGVVGTIYGLTCSVTTSLGQTLNASGFFSVDPPLV